MPYFRAALTADESYWTVLTTATAWLVEHAPAATWDSLELRFRVAARLAARRDRDALTRLFAVHQLDTSNFESVLRDGHLVADVDLGLPPGPATDEMLRLTAVDLPSSAQLDDVTWSDDGQVTLRGVAFVRHLPPARYDVTTTLRVLPPSWSAADRVDVPAVQEESVEANRFARRVFEDHRGSGFAATIDVRRLVRASDPTRPTTWRVSVDVDAAGVHGPRLVRAPQRRGHRTRRARPPGRRRARRGLLAPPPGLAGDRARAARRRARGRGGRRAAPAAGARRSRRRTGPGAARGPAGRDPGDRRPRDPAGARPGGRAGRPGRAAPGPAPPGLRGRPAAAAGRRLRPGRASVLGEGDRDGPRHRRRPRPAAHPPCPARGPRRGRARCRGAAGRGPRRRRRRVHAAARGQPRERHRLRGRGDRRPVQRRGADHLRLLGPGDLAAVARPVRPRGPDRPTGRSRSARPGRWSPRVSGTAGGCASRPRAVWRSGGSRTSTPTRPARTGARCCARRSTPTPCAARAATPWSSRASAAPAPTGTPAPWPGRCRPRDPDREVVWSVADAAIPVPAGSRAVVQGTAPWFEAVGRAGTLVTNGTFPRWFSKAEGQVLVQTWRGTALRRLGADVNDLRVLDEDDELLEEQARQWDLLVTPNAFTSAVVTKALGFLGPVAEIGSPRNDRLLADGCRRPAGGGPPAAGRARRPAGGALRPDLAGERPRPGAPREGAAGRPGRPGRPARRHRGAGPRSREHRRRRPRSPARGSST